MPGFFRVVVAACAVFALVSPVSAQQRGGADWPATISVSGAAEIESAPDFIQWEVRIVDEHADPMAAKTRNDERYAALLEIADDVDIEAEDIIAGTLSVTRTYNRDDRGRRLGPKGYEVRRTAVLILRDFDDFDELLGKLAGSGLEFSIEYSSTQIHTMKREARLEAVRIAREKAVEMAEVLGMSVGRPIEIDEGSSRVSDFDLNDALSNTNSGGGGGRFADDLDAVGLRLGAISVRSSVHIVFELVEPE